MYRLNFLSFYIFIVILLGTPSVSYTRMPSGRTTATFGFGAIFGIGLSYAIKKFFSPEKFDVNLHSINVTTTSLSYKSEEIVTSTMNQFVSSVQNNSFYHPVKLEMINKKNDFYLSIKKGISSDCNNVKNITVFPRGYVRIPLTNEGASIRCVRKYFDYDLLPRTPCVTYDSFSNRGLFNFAQDLDQKALSLTIDSVNNYFESQKQNIEILLFGVCLGAMNILRYIAQTKPKNIKNLVLISPIFSAKRVAKNFSKNCFKKYTKVHSPSLVYNFYDTYFPNFDPNKDTIENELEKIKGYNILIAHSSQDFLVSNEDVYILVNKLKKHNNVNFIFCTNEQSSHGNFFHIDSIAKEINQFYAQHNIPHAKDILYQSNYHILSFPIK